MSDTTNLDFTIPYLRWHDYKTINISEPTIVGHYSIDGNKTYHDDMSQLRYYKKPRCMKSICFNLNQDYDKTVVQNPGEDGQLNNLCRWISDHFDELQCKPKDGKFYRNRWLEPEIICYRGLLTQLLATPYYRKDGWILCASKFEGTIYLGIYETDKKKEENLNQSDYVKKCGVWGRKLEQFLVAESPSALPDLSVPCNHFEEFCCIFKSQIGNMSLLYGAEMDACYSEQAYKDTLVGKEVEFVEIKSINAKFVKNKETLINPPSSKMLKMWCQSYLVGINRIVCGHRTDNGFVISLNEMNLADIVNMKHSWKPDAPLNFLNEFLNHIRKVVEDDYDKHLYKFTFSPGANVIKTSVLRPENASEYIFLKQWYIDAAKEFKKAKAI